MKLDILKEIQVKFENTYVAIKELDKKGEHLFFIQEVRYSFRENPVIGNDILLEGILYKNGKKYDRVLNFTKLKFYPVYKNSGYVQLRKDAYYMQADHMKQWKRSFTLKHNVQTILTKLPSAVNPFEKEEVKYTTDHNNFLHGLLRNKTYSIKQAISAINSGKINSAVITRHLALGKIKNSLVLYYKNNLIGVLVDKLLVPKSLAFLKRDLICLLHGQITVEIIDV